MKFSFLICFICIWANCLSQDTFVAFKNEFDSIAFPVIIESYTDEDEISSELVVKYLGELPDNTEPPYQEYYYHSRFEKENYSGLVYTRYTTSGAAGSHQNEIVLATYSDQGELLGKVTLGTFHFNSDMGQNSQDYNDVRIVIYEDGRIRTKITSHNETLMDSPDSTNVARSYGHHLKMRIDDSGSMNPGVYKFELFPVLDQGEGHTLLTILAEDLLKDYKILFGNTPETLKRKREYLKEYVDLDDPVAYYKYGETHDLFQYGIGDSIDRDIALIYFEKAAAMGYCQANERLYHTYRYEFMGVEEDPRKVLHYLGEIVETCQGKDRARALFDLAGLYDPKLSAETYNPNFPEIKYSIDSTFTYLKRSFVADTTTTRPLDYLGSIYERNGNRDEAMKYYLKSTNLNFIIKVGTWLSTGDGVAQDLKKGLSILRSAAKEIAEDNTYQGSYNPVYELNNLHYCLKLISKEDLGVYDMGYFHCDND